MKRKSKGHERQTNHDVKAIDITPINCSRFLVTALCGLYSFCGTSEDINNLAYALMLKEALAQNQPTLAETIGSITLLAKQHAELPMLPYPWPISNAHDLGKLINFAARLKRVHNSLLKYKSPRSVMAP